MKSVKRHLSLICVVALVLAIMVPTVFAATTGYNYTYDLNWVLAARKPITERPRTPYGTPEMDRERGASM